MKDFKQHLSNIQNLKIPYWGIALFAALLMVRYLVKSVHFEIQDYRHLLPGMATFDNFDVSKRVSLFYKSCLLAVVIFAICSYILMWLKERKKSLKSYLLAVNNICLIGSGMLFFELLGYPQTNALHLLFVVFLGISLIFLMFQENRKWSFLRGGTGLFWLLSMALNLTFLFREVLLIAFKNKEMPFHWFYLGSSLLLCLIIIIASRFILLSWKRIVYASLPLFLIPLYSVLSDELYLILNQRQIFILSPEFYYYLLIGSSLIMTAWFYRNSDGKKIKLKKYLNYSIFPLVLLGLSVFMLYLPYIENPSEMYELANPANGMMRLFNFHQLPIIQALSSHVLSDFGFLPLYSLLNGYNNNLDFLIYQFIPDTIYLILFYLFITRIFKSGQFAFVLVLLFPYLDCIHLGSFSLIFVTLFLFHDLYKRFSQKTLSWIFAWTLFLLVWKIEIGISAVAIDFTLLVVLFLSHGFRKEWMLGLIKVAGIFAAGIGLIVFCISAFTKIELWSNFHQALGYFGANQAHARTALTYNINRIYYLHYFILPIISSFLLVYYLVRLYHQKSGKPSLLVISQVSLLVFYFMNAQRGLVRHSMTEETEFYISSFFYLIVALCIWDFTSGVRFRRELVVVSLISTIFLFRYGEDTGLESIFSRFEKRFKNTEVVKIQKEKANRVLGQEEFAAANYAGFKQFMDENTEPDATFIDFSNTPMFYFYTGRNVPSYFNQYMQNTVTEDLQIRNIREMKNFKIPVVVFSYVPETWWDQTDEVPNTVRYNLIAKHIYQNYIPYDVLNNHYIWVKKGSELSNNKSKVDSAFIHSPKTYVLKFYPYLLGKSSKISEKKITIKEWNNSVANFDSKTDENMRYDNFIEITMPAQDTVHDYVFKYAKDTIQLGAFEFKTMKSDQEEKYTIPVSGQYNWIKTDFNKFVVLTKDDKVTEIKKLLWFKQFGHED